MKVGFIGLGSMGAGMSRNLIKAGHDLVVYNRTRSRAEEMQSLGAKVADTASEAAAGVEVLITMLADDRAVQDVIFEPGACDRIVIRESGPYLNEYHQCGSVSQACKGACGETSELYCCSCFWPTGGCGCGQAVHRVGGAK
jgi:predicted dinucleotide-binding enzyme